MNTPATLRALIDERAVQHPDKPFLLAALDDDEATVPDRRATVLTFRELRDDCRVLETRFRDAGLRPGDVISVFMGNGIQTAPVARRHVQRAGRQSAQSFMSAVAGALYRRPFRYADDLRRA